VSGSRCSASIEVALAAAALLGGCGSRAEELEPAETQPPDATENLALAFDGDDYANTGTAGFPFPEAPHTISLWLNHDGGGGVSVAVVLRKDWESGVAIGLREGVLGAWNVYGPRTLVEDTAPLAAGEWHHVAYVFDQTLHRLFVDGRELSSGQREPTRRTPTSGFIGSSDGLHEFFRGRLDDVRIWTVARSASELATEAAGAAPASDPALVMFLTFDEAFGARAWDRSGRGNHAILGDGIAAHAPLRVPAAR